MWKNILLFFSASCLLAVAYAAPQCQENEVLVDCPDTVCNPKDCSELGYPVPCPSYDTCPSSPGCVCRGGFIRNESGACVPASECKSCGGDPNATVGCGTNCWKKCEDLRRRPVRCPLACRLYGCDCKDGYFYDSFKKTCVEPSECTFK